MLPQRALLVLHCRRRFATDGEPPLTKAQIRRRKAKAAAAARKAAAASGSAAAEEEGEEEEGSDASSGDSEPPPIDFSKDAEFRRRLPPVTNSPLVISPELLAASDAILAAHAALYGPNPSTTPPSANEATPQATTDAANEGSGAPGGASFEAVSEVGAPPKPSPPDASPPPAPRVDSLVAENAALRAEMDALRAQVASQ